MNTATPERWIRLWRELAAEAEPIPIYQELISLYSQPHRHYHTLSHIADCLAEFESVSNLAQEPTAVELAVWFHDAIYDPHAQNNEEKSADLAVLRMREAGLSPNMRESVSALILATKTHDASLHPDAPLLVDVDLSILGQAEGRFQRYETQIRQEYNWVPEALFVAKRAEILESFLSRPRIYSTESFFSKYESQARANLLDSVRKLRALSTP